MISIWESKPATSQVIRAGTLSYYSNTLSTFAIN